jgi:DNA modification methylase
MEKLCDKIVHGDCTRVLKGAEAPFADLVFADPPFNIGYKYDRYQDKVKRPSYVRWTRSWMSECLRVLKPNGSFYIAIGDEHVADVKRIADRLGLSLRNWIIWHYSFGQQLKNKFARSHTHILYFVRDPKDFTFNDEIVRVISDRQRKYYDKRANPAGKMPDDVWDEYPRVCGTFHERTGFPCQMPESLLARIIRVSSNEGDWVLDPFCGSGTTPVVACKLGRKYTAIDISSEYVREAQRRVQECKDLPIEGESDPEWTEHMDLELKWLYHENKVPTEQLESDPGLKTLFARKFNMRLGVTQNPVQPEQVMKRLVQLRKSAKLGPLRGQPISVEPQARRAEEMLWENGRKAK